MEFNEVIKQRKSHRSFKKKSADWRKVMEAIDAANQAPFAGNQNHLKYIIVQNKETIRQLAKHTNQIWVNEAPIIVVICSNDSHLENQYHERGRIYGKQQAGAAIENLLLSLEDQGLAACWVGAFTDELVRHDLNIPSHIQIEAIIPIGMSNDKTPRKKKKDFERTIYWERWNKSKKPTIFEETQTTPVK